MRHIFKNADNSIAILTIVSGMPEDYLQDGMIYVGPVSEDDETIPSSDAFFNCWRQVAGGKVRVNMSLARAQKLEQIRAERDKRLLASDAEYVKLHSQDQDLTALKTMKQALRDLPESVELALDEIDNVEDLAAYEPVWP